MLIQCSSSEQRQAMRAPSFSVNWTKGIEVIFFFYILYISLHSVVWFVFCLSQCAEIVNAMTGKTDAGLPSRICKQNMFKKWIKLAPSLSPAPQTNWASYNNINCVTVVPKNINFDINGIQYDIAKSKASLYQVSFWIETWTIFSCKTY